GACALGLAFDPTVCQRCGIHRSRRRAGNTGDAKPRLFQKAVQNAPRERAVRAATLKREINQYRTAVHGTGLLLLNLYIGAHWPLQDPGGTFLGREKFQPGPGPGQTARMTPMKILTIRQPWARLWSRAPAQEEENKSSPYHRYRSVPVPP